MKIRTATYLFGIIAVLFVSCYTPRYMYSPAVQNVPVLVEKGDSKLSVNYSTDLSGGPFTNNSSGGENKRSNGFDLQGAIAITNNFAIQANYFNRKERNNGGGNYTDSAVINYKRNLTEFGIGYFKSLNAKNGVIFQVFGGVGKGRFIFTDNGKDQNAVFYTKRHQADVTKFYIQPAMIFRTRGNFAASISTRLSIIRFSNILTDYNYGEIYDYHLDSLAYGARIFWELAITNAFGFKKLPGIRIEYQLGFSILLSRRLIDHRAFNFSLGMAFDLPKLLRGKSGNDSN